MAKEKVAVDHSAISSPPSGEGSFLDSVSAALGHPKEVAPAPSLLSGIVRGIEAKPPRIVLVGTEGIGKSTWAADAPKPIFIQTEDGLGSIKCDRFPLSRTYADVVAKLTTVANEKHDYKTLALDSLDWLERLIWANVCERDPKGAKSIETVGGGFAKGYTFALVEWQEILNLLTRCREERGMAIILIAHAKIERFEDPEQPAYDRYSPRLHKHAQALITEWADAVLFATRRMTVKREGAGFDERNVATPIGASGGERILRTVGSPACVAKNRYNLPPELPLAWADFQSKVGEFFQKG